MNPSKDPPECVRILSLVSRLPYLNATIAEVSRLANVTPTTMAHRALADCSILGYTVRKNWSVIANLRSVHMDPDHWVDAEAFRPERFIDANGKFVEDPWLMSFGFGELFFLNITLKNL